MAVTTNSVHMCSHIVVAKTTPKIPSFNFYENSVSGVACNGRKLKRNVFCGVQAMVQVGLEDSESVRKLRVLEGNLELDVALERELREKGFLGLRKTKLVCTVGPACSSLEDLERLALGGMNVARLNMCHNTREWHCDVIRNIKRLNEEKGFCVSVMIDTEGSQIQVVDHGSPSSVKVEVRLDQPL